MARIADITEKLSFEENPVLMIKGRQLEVHGDAPTVLKVMSIMDEEEPGIKEILDAYDLIFPEESKKTLNDMRPSFRDLTIIIQEAIALVIGEEDRGEQ